VTVPTDERVHTSRLEETPATLPHWLVHRAAVHPDRVAFRHKNLGIWEPLTWRDYRERVEAICLGLQDLGVEPGDRVAIHSENRPEWVFADLAVQAAGAITVGVYPTSPASEVAYLLQDSGARIIVAEDQEQVDKALAVRADCPDLGPIVVIDPKGLRHSDDAGLITYAEVEARGRERGQADPGALDRLVAATRPDDVSCIVYTSGTTGPPKGAVLTHAQCLAAAGSLVEGFGVTDSDTVVSYLPLCHVAERMWTLFVSLLVGITVNFAESVETVQRDIYEIAPTFFGAVPRIAEKMQAGVEIRMQDAAWLKRKNYAFWMRTGRRLARRRLANGGRLPWSSQFVYAVGWLLLYRSLRERLGLRHVRHCLVGAAAVAPELMDYFHAMGVRMRQAYGQTECGGASHMHRPGDIKYETVGVPLPGYRCRTDPDTSEVLLTGDGLFTGYWRNPDATAETLRDGWLHTGDLGEIDADGHLRIIGRMKDVIITSGGKNVSPQELENRLRFSPYVKEAIVLGDGRHYLSALIGIEYDTVGHWAEQHGIPYTTYHDLSARQETRDLVAEWVSTVNRDLAQVETIKRFRLLPKELDHEDEELTATQKVRRAAIAAKFGDLIEELYA